MAAIVKNSIIDKIDSKREPSEIYKVILAFTLYVPLYFS